jgi:hypothetical protein
MYIGCKKATQTRISGGKGVIGIVSIPIAMPPDGISCSWRTHHIWTPEKGKVLKCESAKVNVIADRGDAIRRSALSLSHLGETAIGPKLLGSAKGETTYHSSMSGPCFAPGLRKISEILYN